MTTARGTRAPRAEGGAPVPLCHENADAVGGRWYASSFLQLWKNVQNTIWVRSNRKAAGNPLFDQSRGIELTNLQESSSIGLSSQALPKQSKAGSSEMLALTARPLTAGAPRQRRQRRVECACQAPAESWRRAALCRHHCWAWRCRRGQAAERAGRLAVSSSRHWPSWSRCGRIACARSSIAPEVRRSPPIFTCTRSCRHIAPKVATLS